MSEHAEASAPTRPQGRPSRRLFGGGTGALPGRDQLQEEASRRLQFAAVAALVGLALAVLALPLVKPNVGGIRDGLSRPFGLIPFAIVVSVAMLLVARSKTIPVGRRLDAGLGYLVVMSALVSLFSHWLPYDDALDLVRGPSGAAFAIMVFATLVPMHPRRMALAAFAAAATDPLALVATFALGNPVPRPTFWIWLFLPTFGSAGVAVLASRTLYELSEKLDRAREMGSYRLVERLGAGGMGEVWRATHRSLARPAAVKLIRADRLGPPEQAAHLRRRFEREAQATAMLQSPHTIEVYDFGVADDGTFYYVMELLTGRDLGSLVKQHGALPPARAVHLLAQACLSLAEAHAQGMVHRDVKPENIFVCRRAQELDFVKVLDFGIVKLDRDEEQTQLTVDGAISGTPAYLAPESLTGGEVDGRADIYALGCVAFFLLTGELVFPGETPMATAFAHAHRAPPAPSSLVPDLPPALNALVLRCLAKAPQDRPATCAELRALLLATDLPEPWDQAAARRAWGETDPDPGDDPRYAETVDLPTPDGAPTSDAPGRRTPGSAE